MRLNSIVDLEECSKNNDINRGEDRLGSAGILYWD